MDPDNAQYFNLPSAVDKVYQRNSFILNNSRQIFDALLV